jgi:hypothetical protein
MVFPDLEKISAEHHISISGILAPEPITFKYRGMDSDSTRMHGMWME